MRACFASSASCMFFNRAKCRSNAISEDLLVDDARITLRLRNEKGQKARNKGQQSVRQIAVLDAPIIDAALAGYFTGTATLGRMKRRWALATAKDATRWSAEILSDFLRIMFTAVGHSSSEGFSWISHSFRNGAGSVANAIQVR